MECAGKRRSFGSFLSIPSACPPIMGLHTFFRCSGDGRAFRERAGKQKNVPGVSLCWSFVQLLDKQVVVGLPPGPITQRQH